jgi:hypothetical protein
LAKSRPSGAVRKVNLSPRAVMLGSIARGTRKGTACRSASAVAASVVVTLAAPINAAMWSRRLSSSTWLMATAGLR